MKLRDILLIFSGVLLCSISSVWAEDEGDSDRDDSGVYTLGEVVVTGRAGSAEAAGEIRNVTEDDIENQGARTLDEAIKLLPGVHIMTGNDGTPRVNLRGFRSRHTLLLLNGIPFNSTFDGQFDPSIIPVENIAKIKVGYGNHSVLYGQGGLGGVINVVTKKGKEGLQGMVSGEIAERGEHVERFSFSGAKGGLDFLMSGSLSREDGFRMSEDFDETTLEDGGLRENSDQKRDNLFVNLGYRPTDRWRIGLVANYIKGEFGRPPTTVDDTTDPFYKKPKYERMEDFEGYSAQLNTEYDLPGPLSFRGWIFTNILEEDDRRYDNADYQDILKKNSYYKDNESTISGGTLQTICDLENAGIITVAFSGEKQEFETDGGLRINNTTTQYFDDEWELKVYTASAEYNVSFLERLHVTLGYGHSWLDKDDGEDDNKSYYQAGASFNLFDDTLIRASFSRKVRFPSIRQLYDTTSGGNPDLTTEESYNYELGIEQRLPGSIMLSVTWFLNDVEDYIEKLSSGTLYENNDEYRFQGIECTIGKQFSDHIFVRAGYTFMDTEDRSSDSEKKELQNRPEHKVTLEAKYAFDFGLSLYANMIYIADNYYYSSNSPLQKGKLDDYTLFNLKVDQEIIEDYLRLYVGADNLFDEYYEESYGLPQAGRTVYGGMKVTF